MIRNKKKGGGGYRNNPDPQEFRYALRQLMGQSVIVHSWHKLQGRFRHIFPQFHDTILNTNTVTSTSPCNPPPTSSTSPGSKSSEVSQSRGNCSTGKCYCVHRELHVRNLSPLYVNNVGVYCKPTDARHLTFINTKAYDQCKKEGLKGTQLFTCWSIRIVRGCLPDTFGRFLSQTKFARKFQD